MLNVVGGDPSSPPTVTAIPFAPEPKPTANVGPTCDDCDLEGVPLGFSFNFFGQTFTSINISSNGFLSFTDNYSWCCAGEVLPSWSAPQNLIAVAWMDWYPLGDENGTITYETRGTAPDRRFSSMRNGRAK